MSRSGFAQKKPGQSLWSKRLLEPVVAHGEGWQRVRGAQHLRIFLSHSDKNRAAAIKVHDYLTKRGFDVWFSKKRIHAGSWLKGIGVALIRCNVFLLLLSPFAVKSKWVERELD